MIFFFQFLCRTDFPYGTPSNMTVPDTDPLNHRSCPLPQYIFLSCIMGFLVVAVFLRLPIIMKAILLLAMAAVYSLVIQLSHLELFDCYDKYVRYVERRLFFSKAVYTVICEVYDSSHFTFAEVIYPCTWLDWWSSFIIC